jgi:molecular chaperone Hsp33
MNDLRTEARDVRVRAISADGRVRAVAAITSHLAEEARRRQNSAPTATAALGRTLTASVLLAASLKGDQKVTLRILGDGPMGTILADGNADGDVRGYVQNPFVDLPLNDRRKLDVAGAVGRGTIHVLRDVGLRHPYESSAPLVSGEIAEDLTYYFAHSEQVPSVVSLGVLIDRDESVLAAGGFVLQVMPGAPDDVIRTLEAQAGAMPPVTALIQRGATARDVLSTAFGALSWRALEERPIRYACACSLDRVTQVLVSLGCEELRSLYEEQGRAEVTCRFCAERYELDAGALRELMHRVCRDGAPTVVN